MKEHCELLDGPDLEKYNQFQRLQWACHIVLMGNIANL